MKIKYILKSLLAASFLLTACAEPNIYDAKNINTSAAASEIYEITKSLSEITNETAFTDAMTETVSDNGFGLQAETAGILSYCKTENALLTAKIKELNGFLIAGHNYGTGKDDILAAIAYGTCPYVDIWRFSEDTEEFIMPVSGMLSGTYGIHEENGFTFLIVCNYALGACLPATILSVIDGKVVVFSKGDAEIPDLLWYCSEGDIVCRRGNGISWGGVDVIPYFLNADEMKFEPYAVTSINIDEVKKLDKNNVVPDIDTAISAYRRGNGLIHVNYDNVTQASFGETHIASRTFVIEDDTLREWFDPDDMKYGLFYEALTVDGVSELGFIDR